MSDYKKEFSLSEYVGNDRGAYAPQVVGKVILYPKRKHKGKTVKASIGIRTMFHTYFVPHRELRRFAKNLLRALDGT